MEYREDKLTEKIIKCIIKVHQTLGPGFLESIYRKALIKELESSNLIVETEKEVVVRYKGCEVGRHRLDLLVENQVILELKTVEYFGKSHYRQVNSYLRAADLTVAILVNFAKEKADFRRIGGFGDD